MLSSNQMVKLRKAKELLYTGRCTIIEFRKRKGANGSINFEEVITYTCVPCRLSYANGSPTSQTPSHKKLNQTIKLILPSDVVINPGSKIEVEQNGFILIFEDSGQPLIYTTHQELFFDLSNKRA